jgi:hypothetical protein
VEDSDESDPVGLASEEQPCPPSTETRPTSCM